jgi:hypothetical protein
MRARTTLLTLVLAAALLPAAGSASGRWEKPTTFEAGRILAPEERKGPHHSVRDEVRAEGFYYTFDVQTDFGDLQVVGQALLKKRIAETGALASLRDVSRTGVFLDAAGRSLESLGKGALKAVEDPVGTVKGIGSGIKRFGINLGRKTKRLAEDLTDDEKDEEGEKSTGEKGASVANSVLGVNRSARVWARKLQVDPYSRNPVLQAALLEIAKVDAAGGIATKIAVPIPAVVGTTSTVGSLVWGEDPEALRKHNEAGLAALGVPAETANAFFRNEAFTLTDQTRFVSALQGVGASGLGDYVDAAREARSPREALFFVESAEMLKAHHGRSAVSAVLTDSRAMVARSGKRAIALLPVDYLAWTEPVSTAAVEIAQRAREELGATALEIRLAGRASKRAGQKLASLGWAVSEGAAFDE